MTWVPDGGVFSCCRPYDKSLPRWVIWRCTWIEYAVSRDGSRLLLSVRVDREVCIQPPRIIVVENWTEQLKSLVRDQVMP